MQLIRLGTPEFKRLSDAVEIMSRKNQFSLHYSSSGKDVSLGFPLRNAPTLAELRSMVRVGKKEMGVEIDLVGDDHLVILGQENELQFTETAERSDDRYFKIHTHNERPRNIFPSFDDINRIETMQAVVTKHGLGFSERITKNPFSGRTIDNLSYLGCPGLESKTYRFLCEPDRPLFPKGHEFVSDPNGRFKGNEEWAAMIICSLGYPSCVSDNIIFRLEQLHYPSFSFVTCWTKYWFFNWIDIETKLGIDLGKSNIKMFVGEQDIGRRSPITA